MVILDTNVLSETRLVDCSRNVLDFIASQGPDGLAIAAPTISEIAYGAALLAQRGSAKAGAVAAWLDAIEASFRVLPLDAPAARLHGRLLAVPALRDAGVDLAIAAVAAVNGATVATRNTKHFLPIASHCPGGLPVVDPFLWKPE